MLGGTAPRPPGTHRASLRLRQKQGWGCRTEPGGRQPPSVCLCWLRQERLAGRGARAAARSGAAVTMHFLSSERVNGHVRRAQLVSRLAAPTSHDDEAAAWGWSESLIPARPAPGFRSYFDDSAPPEGLAPGASLRLC